ncbi:hypothetical protein CONPUDRAFT_160382 [Coniophora puteana RWD-64-598 SS2]|uniref:RNase H type-1 domain-containing protein n=1 Tax=Coniophora puteana (strain RWD-64-598) TaxID=741705 RepID=R7SE44_CONPW|nr:uncharacterized protein CONPUDRAFT_160382 [Coniophora puteana RWD-64-598 SS2]EIW74130.1 hypothetical protein CONPUDRAFT_160382 [Coniophora puteana RWD-64-598 SS2]
MLLIQFVHTIESESPHKLLGVVIDRELRWKAQGVAAVEKGMAYAMQFRRQSRVSMGLSAKMTMQLYKAIALPKTPYACDTWLIPPFVGNSSYAQRGSLEMIRRITSVQRVAAGTSLGAMYGTATGVLEAHANLLQATLLVQQFFHSAETRLASLPDTHQLLKHLRHIARHIVGRSRHRSLLHNFVHSFDLPPGSVEPMFYQHAVPRAEVGIQTAIAKNRDEAVTDHGRYSEYVRVDTDGSAQEGRVGAAAVLTAPNGPSRALRYHLGTTTEHNHPMTIAINTMLTASRRFGRTTLALTYPSTFK